MKKTSCLEYEVTHSVKLFGICSVAAVVAYGSSLSSRGQSVLLSSKSEC